MKIMKIAGLLLTLTLLMACSIEPRPIEYGIDHCAYCEMTVMDQRYGTELVTTKGKVYTFDSIECLVDYLRKQMNSGVEAKHIMVTPFTKPGSLVEADGSWYLHSKGLPSPMGMYLTAFESEADLKSFKDENGGLSFSWDELVEKFPSLNPSLLK